MTTESLYLIIGVLVITNVAVGLLLVASEESKKRLADLTGFNGKQVRELQSKNCYLQKKVANMRQEIDEYVNGEEES